MRAALEGIPRLIWGQRWSPAISWRLHPLLDRLALERAYRRAPAPQWRLRQDAPAATLLFAGDLALHRWLPGKSVSRALGGVRDAFDEADFRVVNLETVLTDRDKPAGHIGRFLKADPGAVSWLRFLNINVASSANNHALDYGSAGLRQCGAVLRRTGIGWCGIDTPDTCSGVPGAQLHTVNGVTMGILAATDHFGGIPEPGGLSPVWFDKGSIGRAIRALGKCCDIVVVQLHWGYEYVMYPLRWHRDFARQLVEQGADIVCCHHAHVVMGVEHWGQGIIAHGLGNFWFGSRGTSHPASRFGVLLRASVDRGGLVAAEVVPVFTDESGAVRTELLGCPGFDRLCSHLSSNRVVDDVEKTRAMVELATVMSDLTARVAEGDKGGLLERQQYLTAPRHDWLLERAEELPGEEWRQVGSWLRRFRAAPPEAVDRLDFGQPPQLRQVGRYRDVRRLSGRWP